MELQNPFLDREVVPAGRERSSIKPSALSLRILLCDKLFSFRSLVRSRRGLRTRSSSSRTRLSSGGGSIHTAGSWDSGFGRRWGCFRALGGGWALRRRRLSHVRPHHTVSALQNLSYFFSAQKFRFRSEIAWAAPPHKARSRLGRRRKLPDRCATSSVDGSTPGSSNEQAGFAPAQVRHGRWRKLLPRHWRRRRRGSAPWRAATLRRRNSTFQINHYFPNNVCARSQYWAWGGRTAPHLRRGTPRPPRGMASTPQRPPPPQRPPGPKSLLLGRPRNRSLRHLRGPEPPTRRLQPILPRKPSRTAAGRAEERRRGRGDRSAAEEAIEHPLVSAVPEQPLG